MKKLLLFLMMMFVCLSASSQILRFKGEAYSQRNLTYYGTWSGWSNWQRCSVDIVINLDTDLVSIYSNRTQYYQIYNYTGSYWEGSTQCVDYKFYDQDGDRGTMTLAMKSTGQSEIYIRFANIQWAYVVRRL